MSAARSQDREWLERESARQPGGWEALLVDAYGLNGALDLLAVQAGRVWEVNLTRRPFTREPLLKALVLDLREAQSAAQREAYRVGFTIIRPND